MDSVTQIVLGAAVGEKVLGRKAGYRAPLWGAICGTIPDLDVFIRFADPVKDFTYHRSFSHSVFVLALLTPLIVALIMRVHQRMRPYQWRWYALVYLVFVTHVLLDSLTAYGTQILWPFITTPVTWSTIFIIDPLYTVPLSVGVFGALLVSRKYRLGHMMNGIGLLVSTMYLGWTIVAKSHVSAAVESSLKRDNIAYEKFFTTPAPFNSLLWRIVVMHEGGYYQGYYSVFDQGKKIQFKHYRSDSHLLQGIEDHWPVQRLQWFSKGFYSVKRRQQGVVISDLRMGMEPYYVFRFKVGGFDGGQAVPITPVQLQGSADYSVLRRVWLRIWNVSVNLNPG